MDRRRALIRAARRALGLALLAALVPLAGCAVFFGRPMPDEFAPVTLEGGLVVQDLVVPAGREAHAGDKVRLHYVGRLEDGSVFDSSVERGRPVTMVIGAGKVMRGLEAGVTGMHVGGKRRLVIPPELGYGAEGRPPAIPGDATLTLEVELLEIL